MKKPIVLIGQSGSGKTTLGKSMAAQLGSSFCDLDAQLVETQGKPIEELIANGGEPEFRAIETDQLESALLSGYDVISTGGGAVLAQKNRDLLRSEAYCIWLDCNVDELARRIQESYSRPLLEGKSLVESLGVQRRSRLKYYFLAADARIDVAETTIEEAAIKALEVARVLDEASEELAGPLVETVELNNDRSYNVYIGRDIVDHFDKLVDPTAKKLAIVTQEEIDHDPTSSLETKRFIVGPGESAKNLATLQDLCSAFAEWGLTRQDAVVAVGGGVITDLGGFAAATYHRGLSVYQVPTSLLAQIDAAIGGKCGVNLPEGKNLVGSFWQPEAVICDLRSLDTLPAEEFRNGLGELIKYQFLIKSAEKLGVSFDDLGDDFDFLPLKKLIAACIRIKAAVVSNDERESDLRALLNYGHTLGHALETAQNYTVPHGACVATGLVYAAELAHAMGRIDNERVEEHRLAVKRFGFDTNLPAEISIDQIIKLFAVDKKAINGPTFVLDGPDGIETVSVSDTQVMKQALSKMIPQQDSSEE